MKLKVQTRSSGEQEVDANTILMFPQGIPGFENCRQFSLFYDESRDDLQETTKSSSIPSDEDVVYRVHWLQSLEEPALVLSVVVPAQIGVTYSIQMTDEEAQLLQIDPDQDPEDVLILLILAKTTDQDVLENNSLNRLFLVAGSQVKPNLTGPLVLNMRHRLGMQKVLQTIRYNLEIQGS